MSVVNCTSKIFIIVYTYIHDNRYIAKGISHNYLIKINLYTT